MRRFAWLWVLPWTVVVSSQPYAAHCELDFMSKHSFSQVMVLLDKEACSDFAEALNEAHCNRKCWGKKYGDCPECENRHPAEIK